MGLERIIWFNTNVHARKNNRMKLLVQVIFNYINHVGKLVSMLGMWAVKEWITKRNGAMTILARLNLVPLEHEAVALPSRYAGGQASKY